MKRILIFLLSVLCSQAQIPNVFNFNKAKPFFITQKALTIETLAQEK